MKNNYRQTSYEAMDDDFALNPESRCACVLLLDTSASMQGEKIAALNAGVKAFVDDVRNDGIAAKRIDLAIVTFGPVKIHREFGVPAGEDISPLQASGDTPMIGAVRKAIELVAARKETYKQHGIDYYRPWIFLITDGQPTDAKQSDTDLVISEIQNGEEQKRFAFFAVGVEGADMAFLTKLSVRKALALKGLEFDKLFSWLSASLGGVARSSPDETFAIDNPVGPDGWAYV